MCSVLVSLADAQGTTQQTSRPRAAPREGIAWETDFDRALARARTEGRPLLFAFLMDDEPANEETAQQVYGDADLIQLSQKFVCVPCNAGSKADKESGGCAKFAGVTVAQQQANEKKARARYMKSDVVATPQHVFCDPKGTELTRRVYYHSASQLQKAMRFALASGTKDVDAETAQVVKEERERVEKLLKDAASTNAEVRDAALKQLATAEDERALPAVLQRTKAGSDDATRITAIQSLATKGNYRALQPLLALLGDAKAQIVVQVAHALGTIQLPDAAPDLLALLKKEQRDRVRSPALRAAARCNPENAKVLELALASCKKGSTQMQAASIVALGYLKPTVKSNAVLATCLAEKNQNLRGLAVWAIGNHRDPKDADVLDQVAKDDKSPEVRAFAEKAARYVRGEALEDYPTLYSQFFVDYENS